jgi:hypothetical protein
MSQDKRFKDETPRADLVPPKQGDGARHRRPDREKCNPKSEYYVPNDADNRTGDSGSGFCAGPPYAIDYESLAYADSVRTAVLNIGHKDPLRSIELIVGYQRRVRVLDNGEVIPWNRERQHCSACRLWDNRGGWGLDAKRRPPGVHDPDSCDGCVLSKLGALGEDPRQIEDRLYNEWAELRSLLDRNEASANHAFSAAEKKHVAEERRRLTRRIETAKGACALAGFDPLKRRRQLAKHEGDTPELGGHHDRSRTF